MASDSVLHKHILLIGSKPREVCLDIRRTSDISLCLMGGFSLIEACAAGRPIVSYNVEWHSELVKNNETGFLIPENDVGEVAKALDWIFDHPDKSKEMGQKAKNLAFERHDLKITSTIKTSCYKEMINNK